MLIFIKEVFTRNIFIYPSREATEKRVKIFLRLMLIAIIVSKLLNLEEGVQVIFVRVGFDRWKFGHQRNLGRKPLWLLSAGAAAPHKLLCPLTICELFRHENTSFWNSIKMGSFCVLLAHSAIWSLQLQDRQSKTLLTMLYLRKNSNNNKMS